jgi:hypothetical protein
MHHVRPSVYLCAACVCEREYYMGKEKAKNQAAAILYIYGKTRSRRRHAPRTYTHTLSGRRARARVVNFGCKFKAHLNFYAVNGAFGGVNSQIVKAGRKRYPHGTIAHSKNRYQHPEQSQYCSIFMHHWRIISFGMIHKYCR